MSDHADLDPGGLARLHRLGGADFVREMIDLFLVEAVQRLGEARAGESAHDWRAVGEAAHSIKSSAHNFGASGLARAAGQIEMMAHSGEVERIPALLDDLARLTTLTCDWLRDQRASLPP